MSWSAKYGTCVCTSPTSVIFVSDGTPACKMCGSQTNSISGNSISPYSCSCSKDAMWIYNVGCVCTGQGAISIMNGTRPVCVVCDSAKYFSGPAPDGRSCACFGTLTWSSSLLSCACAQRSAVVAVNAGQYSCVVCNAAIFASAATGVNQCRCVSTRLKWYPQGYCGCIGLFIMTLFCYFLFNIYP